MNACPNEWGRKSNECPNLLFVRFCRFFLVGIFSLILLDLVMRHPSLLRIRTPQRAPRQIYTTIPKCQFNTWTLRGDVSTLCTTAEWFRRKPTDGMNPSWRSTRMLYCSKRRIFLVNSSMGAPAPMPVVSALINAASWPQPVSPHVAAASACASNVVVFRYLASGGGVL